MASIKYKKWKTKQYNSGLSEVVKYCYVRQNEIKPNTWIAIQKILLWK